MRLALPLAAALLAGCLGDIALFSDPPPAAEGPAWGTLAGRLFDPAYEPVRGNVTLLRENRSVETGPDGRFAFDGLAPGPVLLHALAPRFLPATVRLEFDPWTASEVPVRLLPDSRDPRVERFEVAMFASCRARAGGLDADCGASDPNDASTTAIEVGRGATGFDLELRWSSGPGAERLNLSVTDGSGPTLTGGGRPTFHFATVEGPSPLRVRIDDDALLRGGMRDGGYVVVAIRPADPGLLAGLPVTAIVGVAYHFAEFEA